MESKCSVQKQVIINDMGVGLSLALIICVTLLFRKYDPTIGILKPGWSYIAILEGNIDVLFDVIANVILFVPFGLFLAKIQQLKFHSVLLIGVFISCLIEVSQYCFHLGFCEIDDIVDNCLGMTIGCLFIKMRSAFIHYDSLKKSFISILCIVAISTLIFGLIVWGVRKYHYLQMKDYASRFDLSQSFPNLLVLNGEEGYIGNTEMYVSYGADGISVCGNSNHRALFLISEFELDSGTYIFEGLKNVGSETVALELEYYDSETNTFIRFSPDIGAVDSFVFTLDKMTFFKAYIGVYECSDMNVVATPVIYEYSEEDYYAA